MRLRSLVLVLMVAGLLVVVVGDLFAYRPPTWDAKIPVYLGDPDWVEHARPGDASLLCTGEATADGRIMRILDFSARGIVSNIVFCIWESWIPCLNKAVCELTGTRIGGKVRSGSSMQRCLAK